MAERTAPQNVLDIVPRAGSLVPRRLQDQLARQLRYRHYEHKPDSNWTSYASQRHVRDIAIDRARNQIWIATWGGVLSISGASATRYSSAHGLIGNATRAIVIDDDGVVWAAGQQGGLCSFLPEEENSTWQVHRDLYAWTVLRMVPNPGGGIYAALRHDNGQCALHLINRAKARKSKATFGQLAEKDIEAMLVDRGGVLWLGNVWGLHRYQTHGPAQTLDLDRAQVCALATSVGGALWVGTNRGLYRVRPEEQGGHTEPDWPRDQIVSLAEEAVSGNLWVATTREVGRIVNNVWQPVLKSPDRLNVLRVANDATATQTVPGINIFRTGHAWAGGANGLYQVGPDDCEAVLTTYPEDALSNSVHCLCAKGSTVWMGTARGLSSYNEKGWTTHTGPDSQTRDVRSIVADENNGRLWIGAWRQGLHRLENGRCSTDQSLTRPLVSLSPGNDGSLWAATADAVYYREADNKDWKELGLQSHLGNRLVQVICYQLASNGAKQIPTLWIGTSLGLLRYRPGHDFPWDREKHELDRFSIQTMALDPLTNYLWIGTSAGLFSEPDWTRHKTGDVRAIAFGPAPEHELLVGFADHFEHWPSPGKGDLFAAKPAEMLSSREVGLAADMVTAIAVRAGDDSQEIWIGSPAGISSYRYPLKELPQRRRSRVKE